MLEFEFAITILVIINMALLLILLQRKSTVDLSPLENGLERVERGIREEVSKNRAEADASARASREETSQVLKGVTDSLNQQLASVTLITDQKLSAMRQTIEEKMKSVQDENTKQLSDARQQTGADARALREEIVTSLGAFGEIIQHDAARTAALQEGQLEKFSLQLQTLIQTNEARLAGVKESIDLRLASLQEENGKRLDQMRDESNQAAAKVREEVTLTLKTFTDTIGNRVSDLSMVQKNQLKEMQDQIGKLTESNEKKLEGMRSTVEEKLQHIQEDNSRSLEQMRVTVDEKLQGTLEKRLGESFKIVSERLEQVHKGLGEMQTLATGVGDLKKVLTNVKTRGTWGEVQLGAMLDQILTQDQYATNVATKGGSERVEFAVKLPGRSNVKDDVVWLPIDSKFPIEDYQRLVEAQEKSDAEGAEVAGKLLETRVKQSAKDIRDRYLDPPRTTDFGILFLPTEGLFAEVIRRSGLAESIQRECRVVIAGPTTLWSILNSLQMGFRTLAIQKRSSEVWNLLSKVKSEWTQYGDVLDKVQKKLQSASKSIDDAQIRTRAIEKQLTKVQELPTDQSGTPLLFGKLEEPAEPEPPKETVDVE